MHEFFHGWRRKAGVAALILACAVFVGWMRSRVVWEVICFERGDRQQAIIVLDDGIAWESWDLSELGGAVDVWQTFEESDFDSIRSELVGIRELHGVKEWRLSWGLAVSSLSLLSACLILWKPRKPGLSPI